MNPNLLPEPLHAKHERPLPFAQQPRRGVRLPFSGLPAGIAQQLGHSIQRVVLIANNPAITRDLITPLIQPSDLLVFFNTTPHLPLFAHFSNPRLFFFRSIFNNGQHWGIPPQTHQFPELAHLAQQGALSVMYSNYAPNATRFPAPLRAIFSNPATACLVPENPVHCQDYPYKAGEPFFGPSSGFILYRIFLFFKFSLRMSHPLQKTFSMVLLGFNNSPGSQLWDCHDWDFERADMKKHEAHLQRIPA